MLLKKTAAPSRRRRSSTAGAADLRTLAARATARAVRPVLEGLEGRRLFAGTLALVNPFALPASDRLIFDVVGNPTSQSPANVTHSQQALTLTNASATAALTISSLALSGPFAFVTGSTLSTTMSNLTIAPGGSLTVTVRFTQASVPAHTVNETNYIDHVNGGAEIGGSLTIASSDTVTPTKVVTLAGYYQQVSNNNEEPSLETVVNRLAGYQINLGAANDTGSTTSLSHPVTSDVDLDQPGPGPTYYGNEVYSTSWEAASAAAPVTVQQLDAFHTQGNTANLYWYTASSVSSHGLFTSSAAQGQTVLPTTTNTGTTPLTASFNPGGAFGLRVDNEYSNDSINVSKNNTGGAGHHFRFFPLIDENGNAVPNAYVVAMDYGVVQAENFDFQDNVYVVTNIHPSGTPDTPTNFTAVGGTSPSLSWTASNYAPAPKYDVYRSSTPNAANPTLLTATPITATQYIDTTLGSTTTAYYYVRAVDPTQSPAAFSPAATVVANGGPVVASPTYNVTAGTAYPFSALAGATDPTGMISPATVQIVAAPAHGTATVDNAGNVTYTATAGYTGGTDTLEYTVADTAGERSAAGTVTFNVAVPGGTTGSGGSGGSGVTSGPTPTLVVNPFFEQTLQNTAVAIPVLAGDTAATTFRAASPVTVPAAPAAGVPADGTVAVDPTTGVITYTPFKGFIGSDSFTYTATDADGASATATVDVNVGVAIGAGTPYKTLAFKDIDGTAATVALGGPGQADVYFDSSGNSNAIGKGATVTVNGTGLHIRTVGLVGTTLASTLTIAGKSNGQVTFGGLFGTALGTLNARTSNLVTNGGSAAIVPVSNANPAGSIDLPGLRSLSLRSATNGQILLGGGAPSTSVAFAGTVSGTPLSDAAPITRLTAAAWLSVPSSTPGNIGAPSIAALIVPGTFEPNLDLTGAVGRTPDLGSANVGGPVDDGTWTIAGNAGNITIKSATAGAAAPGFGGVSVGGALNTFAVSTGNLSADVSAGSINSFRVAGTMTGNLHTAGNLNTVTVGSLTGSEVTVGTTASLAQASAGDIGTATLRTLRVTGRGTVFNDSTVIAHTITSVTIGQVTANTGGIPEGVAAVSLHSAAIGVDGGTLRFTPPELVSQAAVTSALGTTKTLGDFELLIV